MLACSYCGSVQPPGWWSMPFLLVPVALAVVGLGVWWWSRRTSGRRRLGAVCLAVALTVPLPLAVLVAGRTDTPVDVASISPPDDAPAWSIDCVTAFQGTAPGIVNAQFAAACSDATRPERWTAYGLVLVGLALGTFSALLLATPLTTSNRVQLSRP